MASILLVDWVNEFLCDGFFSCMQKEISGFTIDSRTVKKGDLFFSVKGMRHDGHHFLKEVALKGGVAAVVDSDYKGPDFGLELIFVPDVVSSMRDAAKKFLNKNGTSLIGITGSLGKTTVKDFTSVLFSSAYDVFSNPKSFNSQITFPLSILMSQGSEDFLILEMASSEPGNMRSLIEIGIPKIAVVTNVSEQHALFYPGGIRDIFLEKIQIFSSEKTEVQLFPRDSEFFHDFLKRPSKAEKFSFSLTDSGADFFYRGINDQGVIIGTPSMDYNLKVIFPYKPAYMNFLIAIALSWIVGLSQEEIESVIPKLKLPSMRFEKTEKNGVIIINDAYNASPEAMIAALEALPIPKIGSKVVLVLGHMAELGMYSEEGHCKVGALALSKACVVIFIGKFWSPVKSICHDFDCEAEFHDFTEPALKRVSGMVKNGDVVFLKGSRVCCLETFLNYL
ncbi:MAG: UDP-N-acetylmuramoyl-tripeptide--D-alanyl-D-alanine ligase [Victivallaceae bacterium]